MVGKIVKQVQEVERFPDGTIFYSYDKAKEVFNQIDERQFSISDCVLFLLYAYPSKPLCGRISLMKQVFLLIKEVLDEKKVQEPKFVPHHFGMYSFTVANEITNMQFAGYLEAKGQKNSKLERFCITERGQKYIAPMFKALPPEVQDLIKHKRKGWDQLGYDGILRLVYTKYPQFREKSRLKERYKPIIWGRGSG
jgi:hypothetical protein